VARKKKTRPIVPETIRELTKLLHAKNPGNEGKPLGVSVLDAVGVRLPYRSRNSDAQIDNGGLARPRRVRTDGNRVPHARRTTDKGVLANVFNAFSKRLIERFLLVLGDVASRRQKLVQRKPVFRV